MNLFDEIYYETHELSLREEYEDFLRDNDLTEDEFDFFDFVNNL